MERAEFLKRCQEYSVSQNKFVYYDKTKYIPYGYQLRFLNGKAVHTAIVKDVVANSYIYCELERVQENEKN